MQCPHCSTSISLLSPALMGPSKPGAARECPHCKQGFVIAMDKKSGLIAAVASAAIGFFVLRPIPVAGPALWGVVTFVVTFIVGARLNKAEAAPVAD